jgi:hypothetical protein
LIADEVDRLLQVLDISGMHLYQAGIALAKTTSIEYLRCFNAIGVHSSNIDASHGHERS